MSSFNLPCFGRPFLVWHPNKYAELLAAKMKWNARNYSPIGGASQASQPNL
jgi:ATP-dependent phosphoenolpyruvate carboxykinase